MGYLTTYGTQWGAIPMTAGRIFWVAPSTTYTVDGRSYPASDGNDGLSPERALTSIARAVALATANVGDVIALLPGTFTETASVAASKAGLTFIGLPYLPGHNYATVRPPVTITTSAADEALNLTAADNTFINVRWLPVTQQKAMDYSGAAHRLRMIDCMIDMATATAHANTRGVFASGTTVAPSDILFLRCTLKEANAGTSNGAALDLGAATNFAVEECRIYKEYTASSAAWAAGIVVNDNVTGVFARNRFFAAGGGAGDAITAGVLGATLTQAAVVLFEDNKKSVNVTLMADGFAAADCDLVNNYTATVAGGTGGTLITATT